MCGRFVSTTGPQDLASLFGVSSWDPQVSLDPSWNVAPTDPVWAVLERLDRDTGEIARQLRPLRWGLVPSWAKDPGVGARMINARSETVHEKPAFRKAFTARRCLLPADGYFEWVAIAAAEGKKAYKQPYYLAPADGTLMAMAGLYEFWRDPTRPDDAPSPGWPPPPSSPPRPPTTPAACRWRSTLRTSTPGSTPPTPTPPNSANSSTPPPAAT